MNARERKSHVYERDKEDHYCEPSWVSERLFDVEKFDGDFILDPACGWGRILFSAHKAGYSIRGSDIVDRLVVNGKTVPMWDTFQLRQLDFLASHHAQTLDWLQGGSIVCNPPFDKIREFYERAISLVDVGRKVAMIWPARRIAAATWLRDTPLQRIWYMNPRPSMPTGEFILAAQRGEKDPASGKPLKIGGGTQDFCWMIWRKGARYAARTNWLIRE